MALTEPVLPPVMPLGTGQGFGFGPYGGTVYSQPMVDHASLGTTALGGAAGPYKFFTHTPASFLPPSAPASALPTDAALQAGGGPVYFSIATQTSLTPAQVAAAQAVHTTEAAVSPIHLGVPALPTSCLASGSYIVSTGGSPFTQQVAPTVPYLSGNYQPAQAAAQSPVPFEPSYHDLQVSALPTSALSGVYVTGSGVQDPQPPVPEAAAPIPPAGGSYYTGGSGAVVLPSSYVSQQGRYQEAPALGLAPPDLQALDVMAYHTQVPTLGSASPQYFQVAGSPYAAPPTVGPQAFSAPPTVAPPFQPVATHFGVREPADAPTGPTVERSAAPLKPALAKPPATKKAGKASRKSWCC